MEQFVKPVQFDAICTHMYGRRYVWEFPVRLTHWVNALSILVLFFTGLYIANPILAPAGEAYRNFVMGTVRKVHFFFAFVLLFSFIIRVYWFYVGNNYARSGFPLVWMKDWWQDLFRQAADYLKLERGHVHLGHNALGGLAYTVFVVGLGWLQIVTGLAMYSESKPGGFWNTLLGWIIPLLGGTFRVHMWHHLFAWCFVFFAIVHVYIVLFDNYHYKNGLISAIVSGYKFYEKDDLDHAGWIS
jgi:Ni/Fe-hydrogenase 1 B-type cytochrome subunit